MSKRPLAAVSPSDAPRSGGAETKLYQVPRELIEIARANARNRKHVGTLTPIAPRPDAESEAAAKAYGATVSQSPAAPSGVRFGSEPTLALEPSRESEPAASGPSLSQGSISETRIVEPAPLALEAEAPFASDDEAAARELFSSSEAPAAASPSFASPVLGIEPMRACLYAGLLLALGYCAQLVSWPW